MDVNGKTYTYVEMEEIEGTIAPQTPFILEADASVPSLKIPNDWVFKSFDPILENSVIISDREIGMQYSPRRTVAEYIETATPLVGSLLPVQSSAEQLQNTLGIDPSKYAYAYNAKVTSSSTVQHGFKATDGTLEANTVLYTTPIPLENDALYIGEPQEDDIHTGISIVTVIERSDNAVYDLNGRIVSDLKAGNIYIRDGKKIMVR